MNQLIEDVQNELGETNEQLADLMERVEKIGGGHPDDGSRTNTLNQSHASRSTAMRVRTPRGEQMKDSIAKSLRRRVEEMKSNSAQKQGGPLLRKRTTKKPNTFTEAIQEHDVEQE